MAQRFEEVEHTADIAIRAFGGDLSELFANVAYGLACQIAETTGIEKNIEETIEITADDVEGLLVAFLEELLYLLERDGQYLPRLLCAGDQRFASNRNRPWRTVERS